MHRRRFLELSLGLTALPLIVRQAWAATPPAMPGMDHGAHAGHDMAAMAGDAGGVTLPEGRPLPPLQRLVNRGGAGGVSGELVAAPIKLPLLPGRQPTTFWAYNGSVPGPLIEAYEGDTVEIAFTNRLAQPTTIHWHGMPVPAEQDGNPHDPVPPGASRHYRFTLPKGSAGTYWYHPHPHGYTGQQAYMGLAGTFIVRRRDDPLAHLPEQLLVLSDLKLDGDGSIAANSMADHHDGREGQFVLVNGALRPTLALAEGERQRWRLWNATSARILKIALPAHEVHLVGTDGGAIASPRRIEHLLLSPGERAELVVTGRFGAGQTPGLVALPYARGKAMHPEQDTVLPLMTLNRHGRRTSAPLPARLAEVPALPAPAVKRRVEFSENMADPKAMFLINGKTYDMARIDFEGKVGQVEEWEIVGNAHMDHPFHLHGTQFQVLARTEDGQWRDEPFLAWHDVVNVAAGESVRLRFRQDLPGLRMFHCHILEHEDQGMMGQLLVRA
ncbi:multicopper oxidase family protein [Pseudogulbenkiania ferrooxidans]|uniref:Multicopper oxidase type 3 n=1 Tax=Pseudogulbenkiania ferrooxidans 2002 TaxID=279714 RepID=B9Z1R3_9NEIS|nr:multicopper oxidase family protein [Pseudogulbenkiania ferrooxidans]EEG09358.1 multicopper oxidase type 3 [Pseudogulbenkiania ferrooxidans 2002]